MNGTLWRVTSSRITNFFQNRPQRKQKKTHFSVKYKIQIFFLQSFHVINMEKQSDGKKLTLTQNLPHIADIGRHLPQSWQLSKSEMLDKNSKFRTILGQTYLRCPINFWTNSSTSEFAERLHTLMCKCTTFPAQTLFSHFHCLQRQDLQAIMIHCRTKTALIAHLETLTNLCIRFFGKPNPIWSQDLDTQNYAINYTLLHCRNIRCLNTLVGSVRYLVTLVGYTLPHYIVEQFPALLFCRAIPNSNTLLRYTLVFYIAEFPNFNRLLSST